MIWLVASAIVHLKLILAYDVVQMARLTEIKVEAVVALVPHTNNGDSLAPLTLDIFLYLLPWFHY